MRNLGAVLFLAGLVVCLPHCSDSSGSGGKKEFYNAMVELSGTENELCQAANKFGFKLFREVAAAKDAGENLFLSPLSLAYCLGMVYNGAAGETRDEIQATLELSGFTQAEINDGYRHIMDLLPKVDPKVEFNMANAIWLQSGLNFELLFEDICTQSFDAECRSVDFLGNPEAAADAINLWANQATQGLIPSIVNPDDIKELIWALTNAIYFKGLWTEPFDVADTLTADFYLDNGTVQPCKMMNQTVSCPYLVNNLFQAADLPYGEEAFSMTVILPLPGRTLDEVIEVLSSDEWDLWLASFATQPIELDLPKFKFECTHKLNNILKAMGMAVPFMIGFADFSNMLASPPTFIQLAMQKTYVRVDEEGTEAAAVTVVGGAGSIPPLMRLDRPFLFFIHEKVSGAILFMGRISEPVW